MPPSPSHSPTKLWGSRWSIDRKSGIAHSSGGDGGNPARCAARGSCAPGRMAQKNGAASVFAAPHFFARRRLRRACALLLPDHFCSAVFFFLQKNSVIFWMTTYIAGMTSVPKMTEITIPPKTAVPRLRRLTELAPNATTSG